MDSGMEPSADSFYQLELNKYAECSVETNTNREFDPRYRQVSSTEFQTDELTVQKTNGVFDLLKSKADYDFFSLTAESTKSDYNLTLWTRPTITWSLQCEQEGISREKAF